VRQGEGALIVRGDIEAIKAKEVEARQRTVLGGLAAGSEPALDQFMEVYHEAIAGGSKVHAKDGTTSQLAFHLQKVTAQYPFVRALAEGVPPPLHPRAEARGRAPPTATRRKASVGAKAETPPFARSLRCLAAALTETKQAGTPFA
jgi:hypothetical protein